MLDIDYNVVSKAQNFLEKIIPGSTPSIEEIELGPDNATWHITFSIPYKRSSGTPTSLADSFALIADRKEYKTIVIDAESGTFKAMLNKRG